MKFAAFGAMMAALLVAGAAQAQVAAMFYPGMVVKDDLGQRIGSVDRVDRGYDGRVVGVSADIEGHQVRMSPQALTPASDGSEAFTAQGRDQIVAEIDAGDFGLG